LGELLDDLRAKGGQVVGLAARDETLVDDHLLVYPVSAGVADVRFHRWPRGDRPVAYEVRLHERPRSVADDAHGLAFAEDPLQELDGRLLGSQLVRVGDPAWQHDAVVVAGPRLPQRPVDPEAGGLVEMVEGLHLAVLRRDQLGLAARLLDRLPRLGQLDFLDSLLRYQEGNPLPVQLASHRAAPSSERLKVPSRRLYPGCWPRNAGRRTAPEPSRSRGRGLAASPGGYCSYRPTWRAGQMDRDTGGHQPNRRKERVVA